MKLHRPAHLAVLGPPAAAGRGPGHGSVGETSQPPLGGKKPSPSPNASKPRSKSSDIGGSRHPASGVRPGEGVAASGASPTGETTVSAQARTALHSIGGDSSSTASAPGGASAWGDSRAPPDPAAPGETTPLTRGKAAAAITPTPPPPAHEGPVGPADFTAAAWLPAAAPPPGGASARGNSRAPPDPAAPGAPAGTSPHLPGGHRPGPTWPRGELAPHAWSSSSSRSMTKTFVKTSAGGATARGDPRTPPGTASGAEPAPPSALMTSCRRPDGASCPRRAPPLPRQGEAPARPP